MPARLAATCTVPDAVWPMSQAGVATAVMQALTLVGALVVTWTYSVLMHSEYKGRLSNNTPCIQHVPVDSLQIMSQVSQFQLMQTKLSNLTSMCRKQEQGRIHRLQRGAPERASVGVCPTWMGHAEGMHVQIAHPMVLATSVQ